MKKSTRHIIAAIAGIVGAVLASKALVVAFPNHPWIGWLTGAVLLILLMMWINKQKED